MGLVFVLVAGISTTILTVLIRLILRGQFDLMEFYFWVVPVGAILVGSWPQARRSLSC